MQRFLDADDIFLRIQSLRVLASTKKVAPDEFYGNLAVRYPYLQNYQELNAFLNLLEAKNVVSNRFNNQIIKLFIKNQYKMEE